MVWPLIALGLSGLQAVMQYKNGMDGAAAASAAGVRQLRETYAAGLLREQGLSDQARQEQEDNMTGAARSLSMARVIAAEGGPSLQARAASIAFAASQDSARIESNRQSGAASVRSGMAAGQLQQSDTQANAKSMGKAAGIGLVTNLASAAVSYMAGGVKRDAAFRDAMNPTSAYKSGPLDWKQSPYYQTYFGKK